MVASWNGNDLPFGSKYGSASRHLVKTALHLRVVEVAACRRAAARWNGAPLIRMFR